jgi:hypothetical protein
VSEQFSSRPRGPALGLAGLLSEFRFLVGLDGEVGDRDRGSLLAERDEGKARAGRALGVAGSGIFAPRPESDLHAGLPGGVDVGFDECGFADRDGPMKGEVVHARGDAGLASEAHRGHRAEFVHPLHQLAAVERLVVVGVVRLDAVAVPDVGLRERRHSSDFSGRAEETSGRPE